MIGFVSTWEKPQTLLRSGVYMTKRERIVYLITFISGLYGLNWILNNSFAIPVGDRAIWLHGGLLMIIVGSYWIEHFFTRPADVVINGLVVFISTSTLNNPPFEQWWTLLRICSLILVVAAFAVSWTGSPASPQHDTSRLKRFVYLILIRLGCAKVLFSAVLALALLSYFDLNDPQTRWIVGFWAVVVTFKHLELGGVIDFLFNLRSRRKKEVVGVLSRVSDPNLLRFTLSDGILCRKGSLVAFTENSTITGESALGVVVAHRHTPTAVEAEALLIDSQVKEVSAGSPQAVVRVDKTDKHIAERFKNSSALAAIDRLVGFSCKGTDISGLCFELVSNPPALEEGHLVSVATPAGRDILFQVINGSLVEESSIRDSERTFTIGDARQLGTWNVERQGFETYGWVVPENAPVIHAPVVDVTTVLKQDLFSVGTIPNSSYSVNVNLKELVLYHSAILGVTGSGKSFLAYELIENSAREGIKVLCLDGTGDHKRYVRNPVLVDRPSAIKTFLDSDLHSVGIVEFGDSKLHPISVTEQIAKIALDWCEEHRQVEQIREPIPKVLLVLEEAHQLVPEWNSNPERKLQDTVNKTSQIALQARKYGLGFMVITQRTANVTKSILNQCNTIIAFQAYDETGFDFMKNYMGIHYVRALPNLKKRQGIIVGKASVSDRPVIVRFHDQDRMTTGADVPKMPSPVGQSTDPK